MYPTHLPKWESKREQWQHAPWTSRQIWMRLRIPFKDDHRWWSKVGLWVQPRNQATAVSVEQPKICTPKMARQVCQNVNSMLIGSLNMRGLVALQICSIRKNINQHYNIDILWCMKQEKEQRKQYEKLDSGDWFLHHNNAPVNSALSVGVSASRTK